MATWATDLVKQGVEQGLKQVGQDPIDLGTQVGQNSNNIAQVDAFGRQPVEEEKSWFGSLIDTGKELFSGVKAILTKPSLDDGLFGIFTDNGLNNAKSDDLDYVKSAARDSNDAFAILKQRGAITDEAKARKELDSYFKNVSTWQEKNQPTPEKKNNILSYQEKKNAEKIAYLEGIKKDSFNLAKGSITDFAALRAVQLQEDALNGLYDKGLTTVFDIKKKQAELSSEGVSSPYIDAKLKEAEAVQKSTTTRIGEVAKMQARFGGDAEQSKEAVLKEIKSKGFDSVNAYVMQDATREYGIRSDLQHLDALKLIGGKASIEYQKLKKKDSGLDYITSAFNIVAGTFDNATLTVTRGFGDIQRAAGSQYASSDLGGLASYQFTEEGVGAFAKLRNSIASALPEIATLVTAESGSRVLAGAAAGFAVGNVPGAIIGGVAGLVSASSKIGKIIKGVGITKNIERVIEGAGLAGQLTVTGGYGYKMLKGLGVTAENAIKGERALQTVAYTVANRIPKEVMTGIVGNAFDPESGSLMQEHFALLDIGFGASSGVFRQFKLLPNGLSNFFGTGVVQKMNDVFNTPEAGEAFMSSLMKTASDGGITRYGEGFTSAEARMFASTYNPLLEATGKYIDMIRTGELPIDHPLKQFTEEQFTQEVKKSYARGYLRDLYIKKESQITDADRVLLGNLQKLVKDPTINVADVVKLSYNIPGKVELAGFTSNIQIKADNMLNQLDFKYGKTVDEVFDMQGWKPDNVLSEEDLYKAAQNSSDKKLYDRLFLNVVKDNNGKVFSAEFNPDYFKEIDDGVELTAKGYEYLGVIDQRKAVDRLLASDDTLSVTDAIRKSTERTGDIVPEDLLQLIERNNTVDKLISFFGC